MKKFVKVMSAALVLAILSTMLIAPACAEGFMDVETEFFADVFVFEEMPYEEYDEVIIYGEAPSEENGFTGTVDVYMANEGDIYFGDTVTLFADAEANMGYTIRWEADNGNGWQTVAYGETYSFEVTETNATANFRAVLVQG